LLTLEINDLEKGMFSKTMKLTDSKQKSSECKAKERLNSGDKQECMQIRSLHKENYLQRNAFDDKNVLERHSIKMDGKARTSVIL